MSKIKNFFNKKPLGKVLRSVGLGVVDSVVPASGVVTGVVKGIKNQIEKNYLDEVTGEGNFDWIRLATFIALFSLIAFAVYSLFSGEMTLDDVVNLFKEIGLLDEI